MSNLLNVWFLRYREVWYTDMFLIEGSGISWSLFDRCASAITASWLTSSFADGRDRKQCSMVIFFCCYQFAWWGQPRREWCFLRSYPSAWSWYDHSSIFLKMSRMWSSRACFSLVLLHSVCLIGRIVCKQRSSVKFFFFSNSLFVFPSELLEVGSSLWVTRPLHHVGLRSYIVVAVIGVGGSVGVGVAARRLSCVCPFFRLFPFVLLKRHDCLTQKRLIWEFLEDRCSSGEEVKKSLCIDDQELLHVLIALHSRVTDRRRSYGWSLRRWGAV